MAVSVYQISKTKAEIYTPLVKLIRNYIQEPKRRIFHILTSEDIDDAISHFFTFFVQTVGEKWRTIDLSI